MNLDINGFLDKIKTLEKGEKLDLSSDEDLSIGVMNLISIEEHLFFTANKTGKPQYYDLLNEVRGMRKDLLKKLIKEYEGEVWCISKHLLSASMRLMEVGTKLLGKGDRTGAEEMFQKSYQLYSLFWALNLKVIKTDEISNGALNEEIKKETTDKVNFISDKPQAPAKSGGIFSKLGELVQKAIDCCKE